MAKDDITKSFKFIGTRPNRPDGFEKVWEARGTDQS